MVKKRGRVSIPNFEEAKRDLENTRKHYFDEKIERAKRMRGRMPDTNLKSRTSNYGDVYGSVLEHSYQTWRDQSEMSDGFLKLSAEHNTKSISDGEELPLLNKRQALAYIGSAIKEIREQIKEMEDYWIHPSKERKEKMQKENSYGLSKGAIESAKQQRKELYQELKVYQDMQKDYAQHYKDIIETGREGKRTKPRLGIESKIAVFLGIFAGGIGLATLYSNATNKAILMSPGQLSANWGISIVLILLGIVGVYFLFKRR